MALLGWSFAIRPPVELDRSGNLRRNVADRAILPTIGSYGSKDLEQIRLPTFEFGLANDSSCLSGR